MKVIAHRGVSNTTPENTIASLEECKKVGVPWIEFDLQFIQEGHWVIIHDETLDRTTNGRGKVLESSLEYIKSLDAGSWFHESYKNEKIPELKPFLLKAKELNIKPNLEIKDIAKGKNTEAIYNLIQVLEEVSFDELLVSSFQLDIIKEFKQKTNLNTAYLKEIIEFEDISIAKENNFSALIYDSSVLTKEQIQKVHEAQLLVYAYVVDTPKELEFFKSNNLDGFFTNVPGIFREYF